MKNKVTPLLTVLFNPKLLRPVLSATRILQILMIEKKNWGSVEFEIKGDDSAGRLSETVSSGTLLFHEKVYTTNSVLTFNFQTVVNEFHISRAKALEFTIHLKPVTNNEP